MEYAKLLERQADGHNNNVRFGHEYYLWLNRIIKTFKKVYSLGNNDKLTSPKRNEGTDPETETPSVSNFFCLFCVYSPAFSLEPD